MGDLLELLLERFQGGWCDGTPVVEFFEQRQDSPERLTIAGLHFLLSLLGLASQRPCLLATNVEPLFEKKVRGPNPFGRPPQLSNFRPNRLPLVEFSLGRFNDLQAAAKRSKKIFFQVHAAGKCLAGTQENKCQDNQSGKPASSYPPPPNPKEKNSKIDQIRPA